MTRQSKPIIRYSVSFKHQVVNEIENGASLGEVRRKYSIAGGATIQRWIRMFGKNQLLNKVVKVQTVDEKDQIKELQKQIKQLKEALADAHLEKRCLEVTIQEANKIYKTDLKKKFGDKSSNNSQEKEME